MGVSIKLRVLFLILILSRPLYQGFQDRGVLYMGAPITVDDMVKGPLGANILPW